MFNRKLWQQALLRTLPVFSGYEVLGIGYGILMVKSGYGVGWVFLCSLLIYAGSLQFVVVGLLTGGASLLSTALTSLMVNARHLFYGISMVDRYKGAGAKKPYLIFALTDETYSLVCNGDHPDGTGFHSFAFAVSLLDQCYWVSGSVIGALLGNIIPFNTTGIDFSMTALFVSVVVEQWLTTQNHGAALVGFAASVLCLVLFGADNFLIPAMFVIVLGLTLGRKQLDTLQNGGEQP